MTTINVYKTPTNTWIIENLVTGYGASGVFNINEREEKITKSGKIEYKTVTSHYIDINKAELSEAAYKDTVFELKKAERCVDDEYIWDSLEKEFEYRKFIRTWTPVYIQERVEIAYQIVYKEFPISEYSFIIPLYQFGLNNISDPHCTYSPPILDMINTAAT